MATEDTVFSTSDDASSIALLRRLRAGAAAVHFVHHVDVCSAAPEDLVASLEPAPGTDLADGGYCSVWFFYCPKRYKNAQGKASGHRHRAIAGGDNTCWHSETRPKPVNRAVPATGLPVKGLDGATLCNLSYGRKEEGSGRSFSRMGWCMTEYDEDSHSGGAGDHVLCKIYRSSSSLAKRKSKTMIERSSGSKRKAAADQVQSLPATKMSHLCGCVPVPAEEEQVQVQQSTLASDQQNTQTQSLFPAQGEPDLEHFDIDEGLQFLSESEDNTMFTMDELLGVPGDDEDAVEQNTHSQSQRNTCSSIDELLRSYGFSEEELLQFHQRNNQTLFPSQGEQLFSSCGGTPAAMAPPDASFFQGLAF
ncbi:unnamed protein product [Urochloa decumbens]|uniref:NAC domain-containing protein n=1 Tax=Urochloa decumbens TaxID=240449 RepID=A0ABC8X515_9POAL